MNLDPQQLADDLASRRKWNPTEPMILSRLVVLRVALNHEYGANGFQPFDHELAQIEAEIGHMLACVTAAP